MYEQYFRLNENPFRLTPDPRYLYITPRHRESLSALVYGVMARKGFLVVTGDAGTGKTTLIHAVLGMLAERKVDCAFVFHPLLTPDDFLEHVLLDLGVTPPSRKKGDMLRALHIFLLRRHEEGGTTALIVDEAHKLSTVLMEEIRLFSNLETSTDKLLQIVLAGQSELDEIFRQENLRQLKQRISIRTRLYPFTLQQTAEYMSHRMGIAGRAAGEIFPPETIPLVYQLTRGIPRLINSVCDNALLLTFAQQRETVTIPILREVSADLDLGDVHVAPSSGRAFDPRETKPREAAPESEPEAEEDSAVEPNVPEGEDSLGEYPAPSFQGLDSQADRKGTLGMLTRWADRFRTP